MRSVETWTATPAPATTVAGESKPLPHCANKSGHYAVLNVRQCFAWRLTNVAKALTLIIGGLVLLVPALFWLLLEPVTIFFRPRFKSNSPTQQTTWN